MPRMMHKLYDDLDKAKAFAISFTNFAYFYSDIAMDDFYATACEVCGREVQTRDYLMPRTSAKKDTAILASLEPGISPNLRDELIQHFDVTEEDFRPVRTKKGEIVYYQITPQHKLLPLHEVNEWPIQSRCDHCGNLRYDDIRQENPLGEDYFYITREALDEMHDLNVTLERFDMDSPKIVISRRLYDFLIGRYPRTHYFPFYLTDE